MESPSGTEELSPSTLGTSEYWKAAYRNELENFEDHGDVGEVWFGEQNEARIVRYLAQNCETSAAVLDVGCGNGHLLMNLANEKGFTNLTGVDYVEEAISLARKIASDSGTKAEIKFMCCDLLTTEISGTYDVVLDKGTYDAICLMPGMCEEVRRTYIEAIKRLMNTSGAKPALFLITSCNWTRDELLSQFGKDFHLIAELPTPSFSFGGNVGRTVTSLVFHRR